MRSGSGQCGHCESDTHGKFDADMVVVHFLEMEFAFSWNFLKFRASERAECMWTLGQLIFRVHNPLDNFIKASGFGSLTTRWLSMLLRVCGVVEHGDNSS